MKKSIGLWRFFLGLVIGLVVALKLFSGFYIDYSWFQDLGYTQLFTGPILAKLEIGVASFLVFFCIIFWAGYIGYRALLQAESYEMKIGKRYFVRLITVATLAALLFSVTATQAGWMKLLEFRNAAPFGFTDLVFNKDISFYIFKMPLYSFLVNSLSFPLALILLISIVAYFLTGLVRITGNPLKKGGLHIPPSIRRFWGGLGAIIFALISISQYLSQFAVMYSQNGYVYGAGYTDIHVGIPLALILTGTALLCSAACLLFFFHDNHRPILGTVALLLIISLVGSVTHAFIQYNVSNNEYVKEKPYVEQEIKYTRLAYNLNNISIRDYPGVASLTMENIKNNKDTVDNIRLNDPVPLKTVLTQNQGIRYYYHFNDIDIDRYNMNGKLRQVQLTPREISGDALTEKAGTFVNLTMRYTHGYGAVATLANEIDNSGYAKLVLKDIPPQAEATSMKVKEPRIYFGELTKDQKYGYVIGNTETKEFDYPQGENNVDNTYNGSTGLSFSPLNKLCLSTYFDTLRFYLAGEIKPDSKLLFRRNILERVQTLMPYLSYDNDPYLVIGSDGKMYWILDAYTTSDKFPYSAPYNGVNYIRNSVKVVIDAYNGTVNFYAFDPKDPILQTISNIFPGVFKSKEQLPANLLEHVRYPEDLFNVQSRVLLNFHVSNPNVFYNKEDTWDVAKRAEGKEIVDTPAYYSVMRLPGEKSPEFTLMLPFTPASRPGNSRNNMVAWLAGRNDGPNYGELVLYRMPKNIEIQGPMMIDSMINQDPGISGKMTLWGQGGSQIIRGNLMVVPIDNGFIYVEPIYIKATNEGASIPQMQAIVFAIDKKIVLVETNSLEKTIETFFAGQTAPTNKPGTPGTSGATGIPGTPGAKTGKAAILQAIEELKRQLQALQEQVNNL